MGLNYYFYWIFMKKYLILFSVICANAFAVNVQDYIKNHHR